MNGCNAMQAKFSEYLDSRLTGIEMQRISSHMETCSDCFSEFSALRLSQVSLAALGSVPEPADLLLRIRVAVSQERARSRQSRFHSLKLVWRTTVGPFLL
jgi:anti-sigma factor RsiW